MVHRHTPISTRRSPPESHTAAPTGNFKLQVGDAPDATSSKIYEAEACHTDRS